MPPDDLPRLLAGAQAVAEAAGRAIMAIFHDEAAWAVQHKADDSPLTAADLAAQRLIEAGLAALTPAVPVIAEEGEMRPLAERQGWPCCWLVDPLDGTREFIARSPEFTVNLALVVAGEAVLGVVYGPASGRAYVAHRGGGAFCVEAGQRRRLQAAPLPTPGTRPLRVVASRRHRSPADEAFCATLAQTFGPLEFSTAGSAFKICAVAEGRADVYPRFGPTMEWDTAAGQVVVEEAGGALIDPAGRPFRYNCRASLRNGGFLVVGDAHRDWAALCARHVAAPPPSP